jgi:hypothetical protein
VTVDTLPANGTLAWAADGSMTFMPDANYNGNTSFTYTVTSAGGITEQTLVNIAVGDVADVPVNSMPLRPLAATEDVPLRIESISVADVDSASLTTTLTVTRGTLRLGPAAASTLAIVTGDGTATLAISGTATEINELLGELSYLGAPDYNGADTLQITTSDDTQSRTDIVGINIASAPDVAADIAATMEDTAVTFNVLTGEGGVSADGFVDPARFLTGVTTPAEGTVAWSADGQVTFRPSSNFEGVARFSYTVSAAGGLTETSTIDVQVAAINDAPRVRMPSGPLLVTEDMPLAISGFSMSDADSRMLTATLSVAHGTLSVGGGSGVAGDGTASLVLTGSGAQINGWLGGLRYANDADYNGADTLRINLSDSALSHNRSIAIQVVPVADITDDPLTTLEDTPLQFNVLQGTGGATADSFEDAARAVTSVTQPAAGSLQWSADGAMVYTPPPNYYGETSFSYTVTAGGVTETATVTVTVLSVNDAPMALPEAFETYEDFPVTGMVVKANDSDVEGDPLTVVGATVDPAQGAVTLNPDGTLDFQPYPGFVGLAEITYTVSDGQGGAANAIVSVDVKAGTHLNPASAPGYSESAVDAPPSPPPALPVLMAVSELQVDGQLLGLQSDAVDAALIANAPRPELTFAAGPLQGREGLSLQAAVRAAQAEAALLALQAQEAQLRAIGSPLFDPIGMELLRGAERPLAAEPQDAGASGPAGVTRETADLAPQALEARATAALQAPSPGESGDAPPRRAAPSFTDQLSHSARSLRTVGEHSRTAAKRVAAVAATRRS